MPSNISDKVLRSMIRTNPKLTSTELSYKLGINQTTTLDYITSDHFSGEKSKFNLIMPNDPNAARGSTVNA
ncbi:UNVERIFIED_CONTAM: hypothetical protein NCL1_46926 [Trichonephila clavipes]